MSWDEEFFAETFWDGEYEAVIRDEERTAREAEFIARELDLGPESRVLDLACGRGRHALSLAPRVASVVGFDRTARFLTRAREEAAARGIGNVEFVEGDMARLDYDGAFDAAYCYFTAWGYRSDEENAEVLARVARALCPGGRFMLEMISREGLIRRFQSRDGRTFPDGTALVEERTFDFAAGRIHSKWTIAGPRGPKVLHLDIRVPASEEYPRLFAAAGFAETRLLSAPDGGPLTLDSLRIAAVGTRGDVRTFSPSGEA
ncbi:MAG: class I SAM-dependent methyltransferase [Planctomycetes bacterium]|jgi:SAM-dependent methyltransferase|nr:class I SAM-dependent methyltransferase [Planctomycetota bacterium]